MNFLADRYSDRNPGTSPIPTTALALSSFAMMAKPFGPFGAIGLLGNRLIVSYFR